MMEGITVPDGSKRPERITAPGGSRRPEGITDPAGSDRLDDLEYDRAATASFRHLVESVALIKRGELYRRLVIDLRGKVVRIEHLSEAYSARLLSGKLGQSIWRGVVPSDDEEDQFKTREEVKEMVLDLCTKPHDQYEISTCPYKRRRVNHRDKKAVAVHASFIPLSLTNDRKLSHFIVVELVDFKGS